MFNREKNSKVGSGNSQVPGIPIQGNVHADYFQIIYQGWWVYYLVTIIAA